MRFERSGTDILAYVSCVDGVASKPADSAFTLTYHRERPLFGEWAPPWLFGYIHLGGAAPGADFNSAGATNVVIPAGTGQTMVRFTALGHQETHAQTTAVGPGPTYLLAAGRLADLRRQRPGTQRHLFRRRRQPRRQPGVRDVQLPHLS